MRLCCTTQQATKSFRYSWLKLSIALMVVSSFSFGQALRSKGEIPCDLILRGGTVHRGDGQPVVLADIMIEKGKILAVGPSKDYLAEMIIDCQGLVVAPGFIDLHTHSDDGIISRDSRSNNNYLLQGCTSIVTGNCGSGHVDVAEYFEKIDKAGAGTNVAHLLPQGSLRAQVMGKDDRQPTPEEMAKMLALAENAMKDGAFGMATGLIYIPGAYTKTDELIELSKVVAQYQGIYVSHIRGEGTSLMKSVGEALEIGSQAKLPVHISHFKASGQEAWGSLHLAVKLVDEARDRGQAVTADQYPYIASSTSLEATLLPEWARAGGRPALAKRLKDEQDSARIRASVEKKLKTSSRIQIATCSTRPKWIGKSLDRKSWWSFGGQLWDALGRCADGHDLTMGRDS
jgi:N-acyl-D-amino-acid deacylase